MAVFSFNAKLCEKMYGSGMLMEYIKERLSDIPEEEYLRIIEVQEMMETLYK